MVVVTEAAGKFLCYLRVKCSSNLQADVVCDSWSANCPTAERRSRLHALEAVGDAKEPALKYTWGDCGRFMHSLAETLCDLVHSLHCSVHTLGSSSIAFLFAL